MRGTGRRCAPWSRSGGITPAHAGNRRIHLLSDIDPWDHPRACGEQSSYPAVMLSEMGSPPRMRGTEADAVFVEADHGITPAHAGNRIGEPLPHQLARDHPRACGEQLSFLQSTPSSGGSPPRMRGTVGLGSYPLSLARITPAHAGNSAFPVLFEVLQ